MRILDTDHRIAILRQRLDLRDHVAADEELFITSITVGELTHGVVRSVHREENLARLEVLLAALAVLPFDETAGRRFGHLKVELEEKGEPLDDLDLQIASIALEHNLPLATNNTKHFARIGELVLETGSNSKAPEDIIRSVRQVSVTERTGAGRLRRSARCGGDWCRSSRP